MTLLDLVHAATDGLVHDDRNARQMVYDCPRCSRPLRFPYDREQATCEAGCSVEDITAAAQAVLAADARTSQIPVGVGGPQRIEGGSSPKPSPTPTPTGKEEEEEMSGLAVLAELEARCRRGDLVRVEVALGPMPPGAGRVMREIAADIEWLIGVRLAAGFPEALPYSVSMAVGRGLAKDPSTASKALRTLVRLGVLRSAGALPPQRPGCPGTKLYAPPKSVGVEVAEPKVQAVRAVSFEESHGPDGVIDTLVLAFDATVELAA